MRTLPQIEYFDQGRLAIHARNARPVVAIRGIRKICETEHAVEILLMGARRAIQFPGKCPLPVHFGTGAQVGETMSETPPLLDDKEA